MIAFNDRGDRDRDRDRRPGYDRDRPSAKAARRRIASERQQDRPPQRPAGRWRGRRAPPARALPAAARAARVPAPSRASGAHARTASRRARQGRAARLSAQRGAELPRRRSSRRRRSLAGDDLAAGHDLGVDAEVLVAPGAHEVRGDRHVARAGGGIDVGRLAALRAGEHRQPRRADARCSLSEPAELGPGLHARRDRGWRGSAADRPAGPSVRSSSRTLARLTMCTHLAATSEKLWPGACTIFGAPAQLRLHVGGDELLDQLAAERRRRAGRAPPACRRARWSASRSRRRTCVCSVASRSSRISIRKLILGRCRGASGSKRPGAVLDGVGAVERQRLARLSAATCSSGSGVRPLTG